MKSSENKLWVKTALLSAIFTVLLLMLVNYFFNHSWNFFENSQIKTQTFSVQGTASATGTPDQSDISFTVSKTATTAQIAQQQANTSMNTILSDLQKNGITKKDIQTSNYNSSPNYADDGTTIQNYTVSEDVDTTVHDNAKTNVVIDTVTKDGAENISGPNLTFSDTQQQKLQDQARIQAITNAKQKAQSLANAAGLHLGKVINVQEDQISPIVYPFRPIPIIMNAKAANTAQSVPTQINPGQNTVTSTITLTYQVN
jgi:uncharacterized protein YggE